MDESSPARIDPPPTADEAAAILAALTAYLVAEATRPASTSAVLPERRWAQAGRLASQGAGFVRGGVRNGWSAAARIRRQGG